MVMNIYWIIIGCLILLSIFLLVKALKREKVNTEIINLNNRATNLNESLSRKNNALIQDIEKLKVQRDEINESLDLLEKQARDSADKFYQQNIEIVKNKFKLIEEELKRNFDKAKQDYNKEYLDIIKDGSEIISLKNQEILQISKKLDDIQNSMAAAIEIEKRKQAEALEEQKYKIIITDEDLLEINKLREVAPYLRNPRPVYKIIWEGYYRTPTNDLINRVLGTTQKTGIYRLTNLKTNMCYIGQAVNIADRWKQHIKCGLGIDTPNTQLYQIMKKDGVENFKFELLEECKREDLNRKEKYWIKFYQADDFGYNMTKGNK